MAEHEHSTSNGSNRQAFILELSQVALTSISETAIFDLALRGLRAILKADFCRLMVFDPQSNSFRQLVGIGWKRGWASKAQFVAGMETQTGYIMSSDHPVIVDNLSQENRFQVSSLLIEHSVRSMIGTSIKGREHPYGVITVHSRQCGLFNQADADFIQATANILTSYVQRSSIETELCDLQSNLEERVKERTRLLGFLREVTEMVREMSSIPEAMSAFLDKVRSFTGWKIGHLLVISELEAGTIQKNGYKPLFSRSLWSMEKNGHTSRIKRARETIDLLQKDSLAEKAWKEGVPTLEKDISRQDIVGSEALTRAGYKAALAIPVTMGNQVAAIFEFFFENAGSVTPELMDVLAKAALEIERLIERQRKNEQLQESQLQIMEAQKIAQLGRWEWDFAKEKISLSPELTRIYDLAEHEYDGNYQEFLNRIYPGDLSRVQTELQKAYETRKPFMLQYRIVKSNGELRVVQTRGNMLLNQQNQPLKIIGTVQDITETAAIENRLHVQDELLENIFSQSEMVLWVVDQQGILRLSRRGGFLTLGVPSSDQLGINIFDILPQDHLLRKYLNHALGGLNVHVDYKIGERIFDLRMLPQKDLQGNVSQVNGIGFNITRRVETEQALRKSEHSYRMVVENVQDYAIFSMDPDGYITSWNIGATRTLGYQANEIYGKHYSIFFTPQDREHDLPQKALQIAARSGKYEAEGWRVRKDGTQFWVNGILSPFKDERGELLGYTKVLRDFTLHREAEQALRESETRFRSIFEFGAMGIALLDLQGNFFLINPSLQRMLGFENQELLSHGLKSLSYPIDSVLLLDMYGEMAAGKNKLFRLESRFQRKDEQIVWVNLTFSLVRDANDLPAFMIGLFEDITYRKRMETELREVKRQMIVIEEKQRLYLAQELHDDPMQELYGVLFQLETLDLGSLENTHLQNELQPQIELAKDSVEKVIQKLRLMCGQLRPVNLAPFGLEGAIREHLDKFKEEHPNLNISLDLVYDGQLLSEEVRISLFRIYQQAMGNVIRHAQANNIIVRFYFDQQDSTLEVEDDGLGFEVPANLLSLARQNHMGIAGAAERAGLLGGRLDIHSKPGKGTLVRAIIPLKPFEDPAMREVK